MKTPTVKRLVADSEKAALRFMDAAGPGLPPGARDKALRLAWAAFLLYAIEWSDTGYSVARWDWPFGQLKESPMFQGDEPWSVLFREAAQYMLGLK